MNPYVMLAVAEGCGPGMVSALLDPHLDPDRVRIDPPPLPPAAVARLHSPELVARAGQWIESAADHGLSTLTPADEDYPDRLRFAPLRPNLLFAKGEVGLLRSSQTTVAIVGSRTLTAYGDSASRDFGRAIAGAGIVIASGLAYGVDALSHRAALDQGTPTIAVLAGGLDRIYPPRHAELAEHIVAAGGLLLSESPPGMRARRGHFPRRNRILALGADAVLVVEAGLKSGSLHTARFAADFGVPVFAVPGPYTSLRSRGCHAILASGAQIAVSPDELLRELGVAEAMQHPEKDERRMESSADEEAVLQILRGGPRPTDLVARESGLPAEHFLAALMTLREKGRVRQMPGDLLVLGDL
jgi:DNA processing protein